MRIPKTFYSIGFLVGFRAKNKDIFYNLSKWDESGTNLALISTGKYNGETPESLITNEIKSEGKN